jgi:hypothetical protein
MEVRLGRTPRCPRSEDRDSAESTDSASPGAPFSESSSATLEKLRIQFSLAYTIGNHAFQNEPNSGMPHQSESPPSQAGVPNEGTAAGEGSVGSVERGPATCLGSGPDQPSPTRLRVLSKRTHRGLFRLGRMDRTHFPPGRVRPAANTRRSHTRAFLRNEPIAACAGWGGLIGCVADQVARLTVRSPFWQPRCGFLPNEPIAACNDENGFSEGVERAD